MPDEVVIYLLGHFGTPPAPVDPDVKDRVLSSPHGRQLAGWQRPQPTLAELRSQYGGPSLSDEELLLRYLVPREDVDAAHAAGPVKRTYDFTDPTTLPQLLDHLLTLNRPRYFHLNRPDLRLTLRRSAQR